MGLPGQQDDSEVMCHAGLAIHRKPQIPQSERAFDLTP